MADLDDLIAQVEDEGLRSQLKARIDLLTRQMKFGLVFERHLPESIRAFNAIPRVGDTVQLRADTAGGDEYFVERLTKRRAHLVSTTTGESLDVTPRQLVVVKRFGDPAFPALRPLGEVRRHPDRPSHPVICGENFHTLQLLRYLYRGCVDCIYIDPPYNTGAADWKYNNRYVDEADRWRHSKWLSFMEKRLSVAKDLLSPTGVIVVTIDEHEIHHLGVLLEQIFVGYLIHTVTIVHNPKGTGKYNFSRVNEYAVFCIPDTGDNVIQGLPTDEADVLTGKRTVIHQDQAEDDDDPGDDSDVEELVDADEAADWPFPTDERDDWELRHARRRGGESSYRHQRPNSFYAIYVNPTSGRIERIGDSLALDDVADMNEVDGLVPVWPIDKEGNERCWRLIPSSMRQLLDEGRMVLGQPSSDGRSWTINLWYPKTKRKKYKTVWWSTQHDAGTHGTTMLHRLLEQRNAFPFPKSLYAVRDTLLTVVRDRPDALILDFFAGSGTTLHATALINAIDDGNRRCILVSNNEVDAKMTRKLLAKNHLPGDEHYERHGIFHSATKPRVEASITGIAPSGAPVEGKYPDGRPLADGFEENVDFFELVYLDKDDVRDGTQFAAIEPSIWLMAGGVGRRNVSDPAKAYEIADNSNYAVLFNRSKFATFKRALAGRSDVSHVFLVTDSEADYAAMCSRLPDGLTTSMLYRDYLGNFRINTVEAYR